MIKRIIGIICVLGVIGALAGCGLASVTQGDALTSQEGATTLSETNQLVLGTFGLEGTDQAVNAEQAAELVVLWKAYRSLSASDNVAAAELQAVMRQIKAGMTEAQLSAIVAMQLTQTDLVTFVQEKGLQATTSVSAGTGSTQAVPAGPEGGMAGGGPPMDMGGAMVPVSAAAQSVGSAGGGQVSTALYDAVITLLSARV